VRASRGENDFLPGTEFCAEWHLITLSASQIKFNCTNAQEYEDLSYRELDSTRKCYLIPVNREVSYFLFTQIKHDLIPLDGIYDM